MPPQFPSAPRSMPRRPKVGRQTGMAAPAPGTAPNPAFHPPTHPGQHPTGGGGTGGVGNLGPFPSVGTQQPGLGNLGTSPGIHPQQTTVNPISTPFYGTQRGADTQFGVDRMRQAIGRAPVGFAPEVLAKMQADADRRIGFGVDSQLQTAGRFGGAQGALLSQLATAGGATDRAGVGADITRMQQDRLRDDTRYADAMGQSLAQFGQAERGLESGEAGRRTSLEAGQAEFNASMDYNNQNANANRDLQGQGMNLDANQFDRQFQRSGEQQQFQNILQLLNSGQINDGQYRQMIQQLLRQQGMGNLPGFTGGMGGSATRAYARGTGDGTHPGGPALVGEEGPEIAILPPGTSVIPHKPSMAMMGMGGGMPAYKCGTPHYAGGTPDMFQGYTADQAAIAAQDAYRQKALDQSQTAAMANRARGAGGGVFGRGYFGNRVYTAPRPTWQNFAPKGLAEDVFYDNAQFKSTGPKGVAGTGAGSSGIYGDMFNDAMADFQSDQAIDAQNQRHRFAGYDPKKLPKFGGAYANGTPDWQNMVGPPPDLQMPPVEQVPNAPLLPPDPTRVTFTEAPDDGRDLPSPFGNEIDSGDGWARMNGKIIKIDAPDTGAALAKRNQFRDTLRGGISGGDLSQIDPLAVAMEAKRNPYGDAAKVAWPAMKEALPHQYRQDSMENMRLYREGQLDLGRGRLDQGAQRIQQGDRRLDLQAQGLDMRDRNQRDQMALRLRQFGDRQAAEQFEQAARLASQIEDNLKMLNDPNAIPDEGTRNALAKSLQTMKQISDQYNAQPSMIEPQGGNQPPMGAARRRGRARIGGVEMSGFYEPDGGFTPDEAN